jgi:molybdenum cofactor synthesis domain-containing protein
VSVRKRLEIAVLVTGDELAAVEERPEDWRIRDSNGAAIATLVSGLGWARVSVRQRVPDEVDVMQSAVRDALNRCDALVMTGGVSMGDRDHVPAVLKSCGAQALFHKLPQRPGRPVLAADRAHRGNSSSACRGIRSRCWLRPVVSWCPRSRGWPAVSGDGEFSEQVELDHEESRTLNMWWHRLAVRTGPGRVRLVDVKGSGDLVAAARSDGFVEVPPGGTGRGPWPFYGWEV